MITSGWQLAVLIGLSALVLFLFALSLRFMREIYLLRLRLEYQRGWLRGFNVGRDKGYDAGVEDARRGVEYQYDWEGNPIDDETRLPASDDTRPGNAHLDYASDGIACCGTKGHGKRTFVASLDRERAGVPDDQAGHSDPVQRQAAAPAVLAVQTSEGTVRTLDALELRGTAADVELPADVELRETVDWFAGLREPGSGRHGRVQ